MEIIEKIVNTQTGEESLNKRDESTAEKKLREKIEAEIAKRQAEDQARQAQRQVIADRLGLTADELKLLLG